MQAESKVRFRPSALRDLRRLYEGQQVAPGGGQFQPVLGAREQAHAQHELQGFHLTTDRRVGDVQPDVYGNPCP